MKQIIFNDYIDAALCGIFMIVVIAVLISAIRIWIQVLRNKPMPLKRHHISLKMKVSRGTMLKRLRQVWGQRKHFISLLVGVPSYETYVEHMKSIIQKKKLYVKTILQKRKKQDLMQRAEKSRAVVSEKDEFSSFLFCCFTWNSKNK